MENNKRYFVVFMPHNLIEEKRSLKEAKKEAKRLSQDYDDDSCQLIQILEVSNIWKVQVNCTRDIIKQ